MLVLLVAALTVSNVRVARERNQKATALKEREQALVAAKASGERAEVERQRAQSNFEKARTAVTRILAKAATGQGEWSQLPPGLRKIFGDETALYYQSLIQENSADQSVRYETAVGYRSLGFLHSSGKEFEKAEKYYRQSIQMLEALLKESGNDVDYRHQLAYSNSLLGSTLRATKRPAEALKAYGKAAELYEGLVAQAPSNPEYPLELSKSYSALLQLKPAGRSAEDLQRMRERAIAALEKVPESTRAFSQWNQIGWLQVESGRDEEAIHAYQEAIRLAPDDGNAYSGLALALVRQGKPDEAERVCREWLRFEPSRVIAHCNLVTALLSQNKLDEAIAACRETIKLHPKHTVSYANLGLALQRQGKLDEAIAAVKELLVIDPRSAEGHNTVAWLLATCSDAKLRDPKLAVEAAKKAIELDPSNPNYSNTLGAAYYSAGEWQAAVAALKDSMERRKGGDGFDWFFLAMAQWQLGNKDAARDSYGKAIRWMEKHAAHDDELVRFRAEAAELLGVNDEEQHEFPASAATSNSETPEK
jgi:superkiller protein 3